MNSMKRQKDRTLKGEFPRSVGAQNATGGHWRNNSRKNEEMKPKQKQHPVVDVTGDGSKVGSCKEQYCISSVQFSRSVLSDSLRPHESHHARSPCLSPTPGGTWNVRSMNQGKLEALKQEMARVNVDILGISIL